MLGSCKTVRKYEGTVYYSPKINFFVLMSTNYGPTASTLTFQKNVSKCSLATFI